MLKSKIKHMQGEWPLRNRFGIKIHEKVRS